MATEKSMLVLIAELSRWKLSLAVAFSSLTGYLVFAGDAHGNLLLVAAGVFLLRQAPPPLTSTLRERVMR